MPAGARRITGLSAAAWPAWQGPFGPGFPVFRGGGNKLTTPPANGQIASLSTMTPAHPFKLLGMAIVGLAGRACGQARATPFKHDDSAALRELSAGGETVVLPAGEGGFSAYDVTAGKPMDFSKGSVRRLDDRTVFDSTASNGIRLHAEFFARDGHVAIILVTEAQWQNLLRAMGRDDLPGDTGKLPWKAIGWYRKHFTVPASDQGQRIFIDFDGAMANSK